jgi:ATP-dependent protease ClpP protease subunit
MHKPAGLQMRSPKSTSKGATKWFRIENAFVDGDNADNEVTPVYIYDEIGDSWWGESTPASEFVQQIGAIHTPRIELHLNSPGGDIFDGVAIYNALKAHPAHVTVIVDSLAASAASFIAQAGDEVIMTKAASMMIHDGSAMAWGPASVMRDTADLLDKLSNTVAEIYADRAGQTIEFWRNLMIEEVWYNSHEAVESGLADKIGEDTKPEDDQAAENRWNLSIFNYAGRGAAPNPMEVRTRIANRLKETTVGRPTAQTENQPEGTPETVNPASPEVDPEAETTEGTAADAQQEREEQTGGTGPEVTPEAAKPREQGSCRYQESAHWKLHLCRSGRSDRGWRSGSAASEHARRLPNRGCQERQGQLREAACFRQQDHGISDRQADCLRTQLWTMQATTPGRRPTRTLPAFRCLVVLL